MSIYRRCPDVLWHRVGVNHEETLLIREGDEVRMFVASGATGAAIWSRLDGALSADDIAAALAAERNLPVSEAQAIVTDFLNILAENDLIEQGVSAPSVAPEIIAWPQTVEVPSLEHLALESLVAEEMGVLASLAGGQSNTGGNGSCQGGVGGKDNLTGEQQPCHP